MGSSKGSAGPVSDQKVLQVFLKSKDRGVFDGRVLTDESLVFVSPLISCSSSSLYLEMLLTVPMDPLEDSLISDLSTSSSCQATGR